MRYVIAIDVGIKNLGICVFDFVESKFVYWQVLSLCPNGNYQPSLNVDYVRNFIERHEHYFTEAKQILIERQIRCNMRIIESVLQALYYDITVILHARTVKAKYGLNMSNYRLNKQQAVRFASTFTRENPQAFTPTTLETFKTSVKQDDLGDSLLLIIYYLDTFSSCTLRTPVEDGEFQM